jgi:hypothetical protein
MERMDNGEPDATLERSLLSLARAAFKTERTAMRHCQREADRIRHTAPVGTLLAIAQHAQASLGLLPSVMERDGLTIGLHDGHDEPNVFAELREALSGLWLEGARAFRAMLLNLRHGIELMRNVAASASASRRLALAGFCEAWIATRTSLLAQAESELLWLLEHPEKGSEQRWLGERYGHKGASNVGEDESSGSE